MHPFLNLCLEMSFRSSGPVGRLSAKQRVDLHDGQCRSRRTQRGLEVPPAIRCLLLRRPTEHYWLTLEFPPATPSHCDSEVGCRLAGPIAYTGPDIRGRVSLSRFTKMAKKPNRKDASPELAQAEERIEAIKTEIARAMIQRNTLPKSASDEEKAAAAARVEQLQAQHHEAMQHVLAIKRAETTELERKHKEKKLRHKQLRASRHPGGHAAPHEEPAALPRRMSVRPPIDRVAEEARMDAANEEDLFLRQQQLEEGDTEDADELAHQRRVADKKRRREEAAQRREAMTRQKKKAEAKAEAARLKVEKEAHAKIRQQAALQRAEETRAKKGQQRAEREARQRAAQDARSSGWFGEIARRLKTLFRRPR